MYPLYKLKNESLYSIILEQIILYLIAGYELSMLKVIGNIEIVRDDNTHYEYKNSNTFTIHGVIYEQNEKLGKDKFIITTN